MHLIPGNTKDDNKHKPAILKLYDFTKGGTDIVDQLNDYHTVRTQSNRWDLVALFYMLDTIRVNAKTVWCLKNKLEIQKTNTFNFGWDLAMSLIRPQLEQRDINGLSRAVIQKMEIVLGKTMRENNIQKQLEKKFPLQNETKRRCFHCLDHCKKKTF